MTRDTESLIREAFEAEAERAVDPRLVLSGLERRKPRRRGGLIVLAAAAVVIAAAVAVVVPQVLRTPALPPAAPADQNVLVAGLDDNGYTDSIVLAHLGKDGSASAIALPRDILVDIPGHGQGKLNSAYHLGGADGLVATVRALTGATVDHYAIVDMPGVAQLSTAVGGVPVCLRAPAHDTFTGLWLPAGNQTLSGTEALAFLRQRHGLPNGDLDRIARLQLFLRSLVKQTLGKLSDAGVVAAVRDSVHTDPGWNPLTAAGMLRGGLSTATIPLGDRDVRTPDSGSAIGVVPEQVQQFVRDFIAAPPPSDDAGCVN
ncbi:LCP family protein [Amycolatopsis sp.]|uniref:LCP family protein n=1 Tax=Amycolatopsis sp. TaxID=37632 RepID=UPI002BB1D92D|nr:LCP family protein [Amycolatopsis sp.]HVV09427.1 LCP family protein [Amycolatopsis sp.]